MWNTPKVPNKIMCADRRRLRDGLPGAFGASTATRATTTARHGWPAGNTGGADGAGKTSGTSGPASSERGRAASTSRLARRPVEPVSTPKKISANPIRTRKDWEAAREAATRDPGAFHGDIALRELFWLDETNGAWVKRIEGRAPWLAFDAVTGARRDVALPVDWTPWARAFDDGEAPFLTVG